MKHNKQIIGYKITSYLFLCKQCAENLFNKRKLKNFTPIYSDELYNLSCSLFCGACTKNLHVLIISF